MAFPEATLEVDHNPKVHPNARVLPHRCSVTPQPKRRHAGSDRLGHLLSRAHNLDSECSHTGLSPTKGMMQPLFTQAACRLFGSMTRG